MNLAEDYKRITDSILNANTPEEIVLPLNEFVGFFAPLKFKPNGVEIVSAILEQQTLKYLFAYSKALLNKEEVEQSRQKLKQSFGELVLSLSLFAQV